MSSTRSQLIYALAGTVWAAALAFGLARLWSYESTPGLSAQLAQEWPADSHLTHTASLPTLVMLIHPRCPCSRATIGELAKLMASCQGRLNAIVLIVQPRGTPDGWEHTGLWDDATAIPGVSVVADRDGAESARFGAVTSGQSFLFAQDGKLLFAGGITESRGHSGDNAGRSAITSLVLEGARPPVLQTPVYGCPLFDSSSSCQKEGSLPCHSK